MSSDPGATEPTTTTDRQGASGPHGLRRAGWAAAAVAALAGGAASLIGVGTDWCLTPVSPSRGLAALESYGRAAVAVTVVALWVSSLIATARRGARGTSAATFIALATLAALGYLVIQFIFAPLMTDSPDDHNNRLNVIVTFMSFGLLWVAHRLPVVRPRAHWVRWPWAAAFPVVMAAVTYEWTTRPERGYMPDTCVPQHWVVIVLDLAPVVMSLTTAAVAFSRTPLRSTDDVAT